MAGKAEGVHESLEEARWVVAGHQSDRAGWGVMAVTEPRDEDQLREGRAVPNRVEVGGREDRKLNEIRTVRRC